ERSLVRRRCHHLAIDQLGADLVTVHAGRVEHVLTETRGLVEHRVNQVGTDSLMAMGGVVLGKTVDVMHQETDVAKRSLELRHGYVTSIMKQPARGYRAGCC